MSETQKHTKPNVPNKRAERELVPSAERKTNVERNVPKLRFPGFEGEWENHYLSDYLEFKNGLNPSAKSFGDGIKFISVMDILNNQFITYDCIRSSVAATNKEKEEFCVEYGDILFQRSSETLEDVGHANVYLDERPALFGGFTIRGKKKGDYNPLFFKHLLDSPTARRRIIVKGAGAQHFNIGQEGLSAVSLGFPSLQEQNKIADLFSLIDERIAIQNKVIEKYESLIRAIYHETLSNAPGTIINLGDLVQIKKGTQLNGENLLTVGRYYVMNGGITPSGFYDSYNTSGEIISISEGGNSCGYVQYNDNPFWSGGHCYTLLPRSQYRDVAKYRYLYHFLKYHQADIMTMRIGSGLPNIQKKDLERFHVILPDAQSQERYTTLFDAVDGIIALEKALLNKLLEKKTYLISQMFI